MLSLVSMYVFVRVVFWPVIYMYTQMYVRVEI